MHLPRLPSITNSHVYIKGDVSIDASAAIAPGVILQANPDSQIIIAAGVCIGMGAIVHAAQGILEIEAGAILGAGVLIVGSGKIGENACIGATTTIWNASVAPGQLIPPGSLIGERGRQTTEADAPTPPIETPTETAAAEPPTVTEAEAPAATADQPAPITPEANAANGQSVSTEEQPATNTPSEAPAQTKQPDSTPPVGVTVYGQAHLSRLLVTLFPHQKSIDSDPDES